MKRDFMKNVKRRLATRALLSYVRHMRAFGDQGTTPAGRKSALCAVAAWRHRLALEKIIATDT